MTIVNFIWDDLSDNVLIETDENGMTTAEYTNEPGVYGAPISQTRTGISRYYHYDANGSTRKITDPAQNVTDTASYTGFGELIAQTGDTSYPFRYKGSAGFYSDGETGDVYVRSRAYAPGIGRWTSQNSAGFVDGVNLYAAYFVPSLIDPSGFLVAYALYKDDYPSDAARKCDGNWKPKTPGDCNYPEYARWEADFILQDVDRRPNCVDCRIISITSLFGTDKKPTSNCTQRISWRLNCVCRNMPDDDMANCIRGCLLCIFEKSDSPATMEEHEWCFKKCGARGFDVDNIFVSVPPSGLIQDLLRLFFAVRKRTVQYLEVVPGARRDPAPNLS